MNQVKNIQGSRNNSNQSRSREGAEARRNIRNNGSRRARSEDRGQSSLNHSSFNIITDELNETPGSNLVNDSLTERYDELMAEVGVTRVANSSNSDAQFAQRTDAPNNSDQVGQHSVTMADLDSPTNAQLQEAQERIDLLLRENELLKSELKEAKCQKLRATDLVHTLRINLDRDKQVRHLQDKLIKDLKDTLVSKDHVIRNMEREKQEVQRLQEERAAQMTELDELLNSKETELVVALQELKATQKEVSSLSTDHKEALAKITQETQLFAESTVKVNSLVESKYLNSLKSYKSFEEQVNVNAQILQSKIQSMEVGLKSLSEIHASKTFEHYNTIITSQNKTQQENSALNKKIHDEQLENKALLKDIEAKIVAKESNFLLYQEAVKQMEYSLMIFLMILGAMIFSNFTSILRQLFQGS